MCGGVVKDALNVLDVVTLGAVTGATLGLGLTDTDPNKSGIGEMIDPTMPNIDFPDPATGLIPTQQDGAARADEAQLAANQRERRRASRRFGRASTLGAGLIGAPNTGGKMAIGS